MRSYLGRILLRSTAATAMLSLAACDAKTDEATATTDKDKAAGDVKTVDEVSDLKLSSLAIKLPAYLTETSSSLALTSGKRSREACQMGEVIKESVSRLQEIASFSCHIEAESEKIKPGIKYKIMFAGQEFARIFLDNSEAADGKVKMMFCSNDSENGGSNRQLIEITGVTDAGPKGSISHLGSFEMEDFAGTYAESVSFDLSTAGSQTINHKMRHTMNDDTFVGQSVINLLEEGVSELSLARSGSWSGSEFAQRAAALFDGTYGSILMLNSGSSNSGSSIEFDYDVNSRSHFDTDGLAVDVSVSSDFEVGGALYVEASAIPEYLASTFTPDAQTGWVAEGCADFEETIELNPESEAHMKCDGNRDDESSEIEGVDCWSEDTYEQGESETID